MMVPKKFGRVARRWLAFVMSAVISAIFAIAASNPIKAQTEIPLLFQSPTTATFSPSEAQPSGQTFGGQQTMFLGHEDGVISGVFSPDGQQILTASMDKTARLWDSQGNLLTVLRGHEDSLRNAIFSPDGQQILTTSEDKTARLWDRQGNLIVVFGGSEYNISDATFSPDGQQILTTSRDNIARLWDNRGRLLTVLRGHEDWVRSAVFSPDGQQILTASNDQTARLWDRKGNLLTVLRGHDSAVLIAVFSPNGRQILTASLDDTTRLWDRRGNLLTVLQQGSEFALFSPNSQQVLTVGYRDAHLWDLQGNLLAVLQKEMDIILNGANSVTQFSPNGEYIVISKRGEGTGLWDTKGNLLATFPPALSFSPDGRQILTGSAKTVRLWNVLDIIAIQAEKVLIFQAFQEDVGRNTAQLRVFQDQNSIFRSALFSPDSQKILTTSDDDTVRLWDLQGNLLTKIEFGEEFRCATFSPDGQQILTAKNNIARLWDQQGNLLTEFWAHNETITCAEFSSNGRYILTNSSRNRNTVRLWDHQGNLLMTLGVGTRDARFSPDGQHILSISSESVYVWDFQGNLLTEIRGDQNATGNATFSPDGQQILIASSFVARDNTARLWDRNGNLLTVFRGHEDWVWGAIFSPDGRQILTSSADKTDRLWDRQGNLLAILRHEYHGNRAFSPDGQKILTLGDQVQTIALWDLHGNLLAVLRGHESNINSAEFSPDGRQIVTTSSDRTTRLWDVSSAIALQSEEIAAQRASQLTVSDQNAPQAEVALTAAIQLNQQGTVELRQQALQKLDEALNLYLPDNNLAKAAYTLRLIGNIHTDLGQFQVALDAYTEALPLSRQCGDRAEESAILNSLGQLYSNLSVPETALDYYNQALPLLYQLNDKGGAAATFNNIGDIQANDNEWEAALDAYTKALIISRPTGNLAAEATALSNIGNTYIAVEDWGTALNAYQQSLIITRYLNDKIHESSILNQMGKIHAALGDNATALEHYNQALLISRAVGNRLGEASVLSNLAGFYEGQENSTAAINYYQQSIAITESIQGEIQLEELKSPFASERIDPYFRLINLLGAQGDFTAAFNYAERAKARAFLDQIANGRIDFRAGVDAQLLQQEQDLNNQMAETQRQLIALRSQPQDQWDTATIAETDARLTALQQDYASLLIQIKLQSPATASLVTVDVAPLEEIQSLLEPETTLVEYFVTGDRTFAFILTRDSFNTVLLDIRREDLVETITLLRDFSDLSDEIPPELQQLHQDLIEPLQPYLNSSRLIIVPHDILHYLPFAALTDGDRYLNDDYVISLLPSANTLQHLPEPHDLAQPTLLALGNPDISEPLSPLQYAEEEVEAIARLFNTQPLIGQAATESAVRSAGGAASILHLAAHGEYDPINSLFSTLHLAADDQHDGRLEVREIYGLDLTQSINLVVLSACQTNIGRQSRGDEIVGLNRAFLYAGTPAVMSSLWNVDDAATKRLMEEFYAYLNGGMSAAAALQKAQQAVRAEYPNPYFWSAFSITGNTRR